MNQSGKARSTEYRIWWGMKERCYSPKHEAYKNYGGRGISVCEKWRNSFSAFLADVGPRPSLDLTLDRIDNNGNYEPGNVRWATLIEQHRNARYNRLITLEGETRTLAEWSVLTGIKSSTLRMRLTRGWEVLKSLTAPIPQEHHRRSKEAS